MKSGTHFLTLGDIAAITGWHYNTVQLRARAGYFKGAIGGRGKSYRVNLKKFEKQFDVDLSDFQPVQVESGK